MRDVDELTELLNELAADARAAQKHEALAEEYRQKVRAKLPKARAAGAGPALLERTINSLYVGATISRWTSKSAVPGKPRGKRNRPGAAPNGS